MDRWCRDFDNWAICDALCFHLFDRTPHAYAKVAQWAKRREEFVKRAAFALAASLALHDKHAPDVRFEKMLPLIERRGHGRPELRQERRELGAARHRHARVPNLHAAAVALARRLADSDDRSARWIGKDAIRDLTRPMVLKRAKARAANAGDSAG